MIFTLFLSCFCEFIFSPLDYRHLENVVNFEIMFVASWCPAYTRDLNICFMDEWLSHTWEKEVTSWLRHLGPPGVIPVIFNDCKDNVLWRLFHLVKRIGQRGKMNLFGDYWEFLIQRMLRVSRFGIKSYPELLMKAARLQTLPLLNDMV